MKFSEGDKVRIDIPDEDDYDHEYHGRTGRIAKASKDSLGKITGNPAHSEEYRVEFEDGDTLPTRAHDLEEP